MNETAARTVLGLFFEAEANMVSCLGLADLSVLDFRSMLRIPYVTVAIQRIAIDNT